MSGIAGFVTLDGAPASRDWLTPMAAALGDYGPDGVKTWCAGPVTLAFAQFATTPEARSEHQPLVDDDAQLALCFDGRLDNREELLVRLRPNLPLADSVSDSGLLLALIAREGDVAVQRLAGDFAFACWDLRRRRLYCARSPVGSRTFHWYRDSRLFAFATDARVLFALPGVRRNVNEAVVGEILALRFTSPDETLWKDVFRLVAGWGLAVQDGAVKISRWQTGPFPEVELGSDEAYAERFRELFDQALRATTRAAGPVAGQLSGGLDSSSVICRSAQLHARGDLASAVQPISAVFPGEPHDEGRWIESVEVQAGVRTIRVQQRRYDWDWAEAWTARTLHLPLRPNTAGTIIAVGEELRSRGVRVLLTGEGGDDWFSGSIAHWPDLVRRGRWRQLLREAASPERPRWRSALTAASRGIGPLVLLSRKRDLLNPHLRLGLMPAWIRPEWAERIGLAERVPAPNPLPHLSGFAQQQRSLRYDFGRHYVNWENVLAFVASQRIELRHPFHDRRMTDFAMGLPGYQLMRHGVRKHILREAMRGTLPELVRLRSSKAMFITPLTTALSERLKRRPMAEMIGVKEGWLDGALLERMLKEHEAWHTAGAVGRAPDAHINAVWMVMALDLWLRAAANFGPR